MFERMYKQSDLHHVLNMAKTISKEECRLIYEYFERKRPGVLFEFGTQYGCSTKAFQVIANCLGFDLDIHSWDIVDEVRCIDKSEFHFHLEDITKTEPNWRDWVGLVRPDTVFLDAHPYELTKGLIETCLKYKIDFIAHDIDCYERARKESSNFKDKTVITQWESFLVPELVDKSLITEDYFENDKLKATCVRERFGLCIVEMKS